MRLNDYRVLREHHRGTLGVIYEAVQDVSSARVGILVLDAAWSSAGMPPLQTLQVYAATLQKLQLSGLVPLLSCGVLPSGQRYLVTQWMQGRPLSELLARAPLSDGIELAQQLAAHLELAHRHGLVHLALRPSQILVSGRGARQIYLWGLGLVSLLQPPATVWSPAQRPYIAPELLDGRGGPRSGLGPTTDVFSLGVLVRAMLAAHDAQPTPTRGGRSKEAAGAALRELLEGMTAVDPAARPTMAEVNERLFQLREARSPSLLERVRRGFLGLNLNRHSRTTLKQPESETLILEMQSAAPAGAAATLTAPVPKSDAAHAAAPDGLCGQEFGSYRLVRRLGEGAMGTVYEATEALIGHRTAIKVLRPQFAANREYARRFLAEARAVNIVRHDGLVSVIEFGQRADGRLFIVMEYLDGGTLEDLMARRNGPLPESESRLILTQVARALATAHQHGVVHRDLKPSNIMLVPDAMNPGAVRVKILDFGIAKVAPRDREAEDLTAIGCVMGTPLYMAPEQYGKAETVDGKADVFAAGVVLFEMLAGQTPFHDSSSFRVVAEQARPLRSVAPAVSEEVAALVARMLHSDPRERPSMSEVVTSLTSTVAPAPLHAPWRKRRWLLPMLAVGVAAAGTVGYVSYYPNPERSRKEAQKLRQDALGYLRHAMTSSDPQLRSAAARALGQTRDPIHRADLEALLTDKAREVIEAATLALADLDEPEAVPALRALFARTPELTFTAALAMTRLGAADGITVLRQIARGDNPLAALDAALALARSGAEPATAPLWEMFERLPRSATDRLPALERLAQIDVARATEQLRQLAAASQKPSERIAISGQLARLGDEQAAQLLRLSSATAAPDQIFAAWALVEAGDASGCKVLRRTLRAQDQIEEKRILAANGLRRCGGRSAALALAPLLGKSGGSELLQVTVAGTVLVLLGPEDERTAAVDQLSLAQRLLRSDSPSQRFGAVAVLGDLEDERAMRPLEQISRDPSQDASLRAAAIRALGHKRVSRALEALRFALVDASTDIRTAGLRAIMQVLSDLPSSERALGEDLRARLHSLANSADQIERVIAEVALLRSGESQRERAVQELLRTGAEPIRRLLVEIVAPRDAILYAALTDRAPSVRFFAARRLARSGDRAALTVLREAVNRSGEEAILAYWLLRQLGENPARPPEMSSMLTRAHNIPLRFAVVQVLEYLPLTDALPELNRAVQDSASVVRGEVARVAAALYRRFSDERLLDLLRSLASDEEFPVRTRARALLADLTQPVRRAPIADLGTLEPGGQKQVPRASDASPATLASKVPDVAEPAIDREGAALDLAPPQARPSAVMPAPAPMALATLSVRGTPGLRLTVQPLNRTLTVGSQTSLPAGRYELQSACRTESVLLAAGKPHTATLDCSLSKQLVIDAAKERKQGKLEAAAQLLGEASRQLQGSKDADLLAPVLVEQVRLSEAQSQLGRLVLDFNQARRVVQDARSPALKTALDQIYDRIRPQLGTIRICRAEPAQQGRCVCSVYSLHMPHSKVQFGDATGSFTLGPGEVKDIDHCKSGK